MLGHRQANLDEKWANFFLKRHSQLGKIRNTGPVFSYKLRHIVGFWLVEMAISTNQKPTIYRNLYENTGPAN